MFLTYRRPDDAHVGASTVCARAGANRAVDAAFSGHALLRAAVAVAGMHLK
jgi:hypothetical protein